MRRSLSALVLLLFLSSALSGCLSNTDTTTKDEEDSGTTPSQNGGLFCTEHDGLERCWEKHVPENLDPDVPVPLVVDVHGYSSTSSTHKDLSGFDEIADSESAIVVYPNGVLGKNLPTDPDENQAWNAGWCCAHASRDNIDDVGFISKIIELTIEEENIDADRIYASGWSNGCAMVQRLAMEMSHVFAAAWSVRNGSRQKCSKQYLMLMSKSSICTEVVTTFTSESRARPLKACDHFNARSRS